MSAYYKYALTIYFIISAERDEAERERGHDGRRPGPDSSGGRGERHLSGDIRAQFMADLRRLGGNIPTQSSEIKPGLDIDGSDQQAATSTTVSPPPLSKLPPHQFPSPTGPACNPSKRSVSCEENLPPRKRKVSQEHHMTHLSQETTIISNNGQRSPPHKYNGIHPQSEGDSAGSSTPPPPANSHAKSTGSSAESESGSATSPVGSPEKSSENMLKEDPPSSSLEYVN